MKKTSFAAAPMIAALITGTLAISSLPGCTRSGSNNAISSEEEADHRTDSTRKAVIKEAFSTDRDEGDNVDSPTIWHGKNGEHWLLATAKEGNAILVYDAADGSFIKRYQGQENALSRPNGITVIDDLLLVVERDNHRIQVLRLPDFKPLGSFGEKELKRPYGITGDLFEGVYQIYITDNYETPDEQIPAAGELGGRVHYYTFSLTGARLDATHQKAFGDTAGTGILHKVESIYLDRIYNRLLIADELETQRNIKIYQPDGTFTGEIIPNEFFRYEPEGIALYACADSSGYWVMTDQDEQDNTFQVFDRETLSHIGSFGGELTRNTDGIVLTQQSFPPFEKGAFYPVHDDGSVTAISWADIAGKLSLKTDCTN